MSDRASSARAVQHADEALLHGASMVLMLVAMLPSGMLGALAVLGVCLVLQVVTAAGIRRGRRWWPVLVDLVAVSAMVLVMTAHGASGHAGHAGAGTAGLPAAVPSVLLILVWAAARCGVTARRRRDVIAAVVMGALMLPMPFLG